DVPRQVLRDYASAHALAVIDDPANMDPQLARSFLRQDIMPRLRQHWPQVEAALTHAATLCRAAADYIDTDVEFALQQLRAGETNSLDADAWLALDSALRAPTLHRWLHQQGLPAPTSAQRRQLEQQIAHAADDRVPQVDWPGAVIRLWRKRLYAMPPPHPLPAQWRRPWDGQPLALPSGGVLYLSPAAERLQATLEVRLREGGERLQPTHDAHTRELRDLLQRAAIPPWLGPCCPLLYAQGELVAIADLYASAAGEALFTRLGARPCWQRSNDSDATEPLH
ncbi:MAG: tRNA lysidine(34) synthetase TilS, partial [Xanthomonadales bacterium]|nr:tRNA lysidine(34) synthetase TilS [Xanthomonadales bacterium]